MASDDTQSGREGSGFGTIVRRVLVMVLWVAVWQLASAVVGNGLILAGPVQTFDALCSLVGQGAFWSTVAGTFLRIVSGFLVAFILAIALASAASRWRLVREILQPFMAAVKSTPVVCIVVLLLIWFGSRGVSTISVFLVVLPAVYFSAFEALGQIDRGIDEMLRIHDVGTVRRIGAFVWPSMQPYLLATSKMVVGMGWKAGVAAELIGIPLGSIGERIYQSKLLLETEDLFAWTIVVVVLAFVCEKAFLALLSWSVGALRRASLPQRPTSDPSSVGPCAEVTLDDVTIAFDGHAIAEHVTRRYAAGSRTCVSDASGTGKTSALRLMAGLARPTLGVVSRPRHVSMAFQDVRLIEGLDARDNIALVAGRWRSPAQINELLRELLPEESLSRPVSELSGGMRRRVELCRAIATPSQVVLLDEPFASLDDESHERAAKFVLSHLAGRTLVTATHDAEDARLLDAEACKLFS